MLERADHEPRTGRRVVETSRAVAALALMLVGCEPAAPPTASLEPDPVDLAGRAEASLGPALTYLVDPSGARTLDEVRRGPLRAHSADRLNLGYTPGVVWIRVLLRLPAAHRWILEVDMPALDELDVFVEREDGELERHRAGDRRPVSARDLATPAFAFALPPSQDPIEVFVRVRTEGPCVVPLTVIRQDTFDARLARRGAMAGLFFGVLLALSLYNLLLFAVVRSPGYGWYGALLACLGLFSAARSGHAALYLWPDASDFAHRAPTLFGVLSLAVAARFVRVILDTDSTMPRVHRALGALSLLALALTPGVWLFYGLTVRALTGLALLLALAVPPLIAIAWRRGSWTARYFAVAHAAISVGVVMVALRSLGAVPASFWTEHLVTIGAGLEALLLSLALADSLRRLSAANDAGQRALALAERAALDAQRAFSDRLLGAQDLERQRIAADLHDGLGQNLLALLTQLRRREEDDASVAELTSVAAESVGELRSIARGLHPARLDRLGVSDALRTMAEEMLGAAHVEHEVVVADIDAQVAPSAALHLYRIAQEALTNVVRHSRAEESVVILREEAEGVVLSVRDDGVAEVGVLREGVGLSSIRARARAIGAEVTIGAGLGGRGLGIRVRLPRAA